MGNGDELIKLRFGEKVKEYRSKKNLTQLDLAAKIGIDTRQIQRIEGGKINTSVTTVYLLSKALEVSMNELFDF